MTDPFGGFDPQAWLADYGARAQRMYAEATRQQQALASLTAEATAGAVTVRIGVAGALRGVEMADGVRPSAAELTTSFEQAYRTAVQIINDGTAQHAGGVDAAVRESGPGPAEDTGPGPRPATGHLLTEDDTTVSVEMPIDAEFDEFLAALDEGEPEDLTAIVNNPVFQRYRSPGDPNTWQADLQRQVQRITANAAQITELAARITGRAETPEMTIEVGSQGRIDSLRFTDRVTRLRREQVGAAIIEVYTEAARDAERQLAEALAELGITPQE